MSNPLDIFDQARPYLKLERNKRVTWCFDGYDSSQPNKESFVKTEITEFDDDKNPGKKKKVARMIFQRVLDLEKQGEDYKTFRTSSEKLCRKLYNYFERGSYCLEIEWTGEGQSTDYDIYPVTRDVDNHGGEQ